MDDSHMEHIFKVKHTFSTHTHTYILKKKKKYVVR